LDRATGGRDGICKRIRVHVRRGAIVYDAAFWGLLTIYELEYLPLARLASPRALGVLARRWRDLVGYVPTFVRPARSLEALSRPRAWSSRPAAR